MQLTNTIGNNIKKWRVFRGYKQDHFATKLGVSRVTLSKYENDHTNISASLLASIANTLNVPLSELINDLDHTYHHTIN